MFSAAEVMAKAISDAYEQIREARQMSAQRTLDSVCELIVDCEHKTAPTQEHGYPSIRTPNIGRGRFLLEGVNRVSDETYQAWTKRAVPQENDLILAREAPVGNVAIITKGLKVCLGQRTVLIRPDKSKVDPHYLVYLLLENEVQGKFHSFSGGATVAHLNMKDIRNLILPEIPPLSTQCKIAAILCAYDDLIENNTRRIKVLEEMAQAIYREWFVNFRFPGHEQVRMVDSPLGRMPEGWGVVALGDIAKESRRGVDPEKVDPETPYIGLEHLPRRSITLGDWGAAIEVESTKLAFLKGEILFGKIRPYFHKVGIAPLDGICSSDAIVISAKKQEMMPLVLACVSSDEFVAHATRTSQGTKMPRADWKVLVKYPVALPDDGTLKQFNAFLTDAISQTQRLMFKNQNLRQTRDLLLPKLISGAVDVGELDIDIKGAA